MLLVPAGGPDHQKRYSKRDAPSFSQAFAYALDYAWELFDRTFPFNGGFSATLCLTLQPLDWATRKLADKNDGVGSRIAADELKGEKCTQDPHSVASHLDRKSKLYDRLGALLQQKIAQRVFLFINYAPSFICLEIVLLCCLEVGGLEHSTSAVQLLQLHQKRRITERIDSQAEPAGPRLSAEALAELLNFNE